MSPESIPDDQQLPTDRALKGFEKLDPLRRADPATVEAQAKTPERHTGDHQESLLPETVLMDRSPTPRIPNVHATLTRLAFSSHRMRAGLLAARHRRRSNSISRTSMPVVASNETIRKH